MEKQSFTLELNNDGTVNTVDVKANCTNTFLTNGLAHILKKNPALLSIFLDAVGVALLDNHRNCGDCEHREGCLTLEREAEECARRMKDMINLPDVTE